MSKTTNKTRKTIPVVDMRHSAQPESYNKQVASVMAERNKKGANYESMNEWRLKIRGLKVLRKSDAATEYIDGNVTRTLIPDHYIIGKNGHWWTESTIMLDEKRADEFNIKKDRAVAANPDNKYFVIFFEQNSKQKTRNNIDRYVRILENNGWKVCVGKEEVEEYMDYIASIEKVTKQIKVANVKMISVKNLKNHKSNRRIDHDRCEILANHIINHGFITQINVVPEWVRGRFTGNYVIFEGNHRYVAVMKYVIEKYGYEIDELPCVVVDWVRSSDKEKLHEMLVLTNTSQAKWGMPDYVESNLKDGVDRKDEKKMLSYGTLQWLYDITKPTHKDNKFNHKFNDSRMFYVFGPIDFNSSAVTKPVNRKLVKSGKFTMTEHEVNNVLTPFVKDVGMPFLKWFDDEISATRSKIIGDVFLKYVYNIYKDDVITIREAKKLIADFKKLGDKMPAKIEKKRWKQMFDDLGIILQ